MLSPERPKSAVEATRDAADAMFRAARECCHQHDRVARIVTKSAVEEEVRDAQVACEQCDAALDARVSAYEEIAADVRPADGDGEWWRRANALWLAGREYLRRNGCCDAATKELKHHGPERLGALHKEYELEGSALLALRQAADAYGKNRPAAA
jgi:hypothetical protein